MGVILNVFWVIEVFWVWCSINAAPCGIPGHATWCSIFRVDCSVKIIYYGCPLLLTFEFWQGFNAIIVLECWVSGIQILYCTWYYLFPIGRERVKHILMSTLWNCHEWPSLNFSLQYKLNNKQTSDWKKILHFVKVYRHADWSNLDNVAKSERNIL